MDIVHPAFAGISILILLSVSAAIYKWRTPDLPMSHYPTIDGLRGYLAFFVFLHHAVITYFFIVTGEWRVPPSNLFTQLGQASVMMFFMITSFLFYGKVIDNRNRSIDWLKFFVGRLFRLGPVYGIVMMGVFGLVWIESGGVIVEPVGQLSIAAIKWLSFTLLGGPFMNGINTWRLIAGVNWSLPYEWYFYLAMPLLAWSGKVRVPLAYLVLSVLAMGFAWSRGISIFFGFVFLGGIFAAVAVRQKLVVWIARTRMAQGFLLICLVMLVELFPSAYEYPQLVLMTAIFTLIASGCNPLGILSVGVSRFIGQLSYSIYLLHGVFLFVTTKYLVGYDVIREMSPFGYWALVFGLTPVLLISATFLFRQVEFPAMQMSSRAVVYLRALGSKNVLVFKDPLANPNDIDRPAV